MLKRLCTSAFKSSVPVRNFVISPRRGTPEFEHGYQPLLDLYAKRLRKIVLDRTVLEKTKLIVPAVRVRQEEDTLEKLRNSQLCAGVIAGREEFEDLDLVFQSRQISILNHRRDAYVHSYHIKVGDELIRCTFDKFTRHHVHNWIIQAKFNRYIVGRPNLIYLPLKLVFNNDNKYFNKGSEMIVKYQGLWFYSYNDDYPAAIDVDFKTANPTFGYRLGELANKFPDGLELHPKYKNQLNNFVVELEQTRDVHLQKELDYLEMKKKIKAGIQVAPEEVKIEEWSDEDPEEIADREARKARKEAKQAERREWAKKNPRSLKKQVAMMNFKVKDSLGLNVTLDKPQKKGQKPPAD